MLEKIFDVLFPPRCLGCDAREENDATLCMRCRNGIGTYDTLFCSECLARLPYAKKICHRGTPYLLGAAADYHAEPVKNIIHALKFKGVESAAKPLSDLLVSYISKTGFALEDYEVVPVPLGKRRERERGFNQAECIARVFASHFNLPLRPSLLFRTRETAPQSDLKDFAKREANVEHCFTAAQEIPGKRIIIVDDVVTSGATLHEAARALKARGARTILGLGVAKA